MIFQDADADASTDSVDNPSCLFVFIVNYVQCRHAQTESADKVEKRCLDDSRFGLEFMLAQC